MRNILLAGVASILIINPSAGQGCSDAGVCTIHSFKDNRAQVADQAGFKNELVTGFSFGKGERSVSYYTPYLQYTRHVSAHTSASLKFTYNAISGELASTAGAGDLFLSLDHRVDRKSKWKKSIFAGFKIPLADAGLSKNAIELPMPYQPGLGTTDLILGLNIARDAWGATIAWQQPLNASNENAFLPENYPGIPLANRYLPTNQFGRKADLVARLTYDIPSKTKLSLRPGLLGIYHVGDDTYVDINKTRREIDKSAGLTLNGVLFAGYNFNDKNRIELSVGTPFVVRTNRPDGLTRSFVTSLEYRILF